MNITLIKQFGTLIVTAICCGFGWRMGSHAADYSVVAAQRLLNSAKDKAEKIKDGRLQKKVLADVRAAEALVAKAQAQAQRAA